MSERLTLPVLPLRDIVLFPGVSTPIGAGRPTTLRAIEAALKGESRVIFAVSQRENVDGVTDPGKLADLVAGYLEIDAAERQALLETLSVEERLRRVLVHVQRQIGVLDAQEQIKSQVQEELGERQRELFLREICSWAS